MTRSERRWRDALLAAMIPGAGDLPPLGELDLAPFWAIVKDTSPPLARFGLRAAVWTLTWLPLFYLGKPLPFHRLRAGDRDRFLLMAAHSRWYLVRQLAATIKVFACLAYLRDPRVRALVEARP